MTTTKKAKTTERIDYEAMPRMKAYHPVKYGGDFTQRKIEGLEAYANVCDVSLKRARSDSQEGAARDMIAMIERAEQIAIRANPPVYCRAYVERSDYPLTSFYDDYKTLIERREATWSDYHAERKKWKHCAYKFCLNVFPKDKNNFKEWLAKRKDARYCDDQCKNGAHNAERSFDRTGSYMPEWYWLPRLSESVGDDIRKHEFTAESDKIEKRINKRKPMRYAVIKDDTEEIARALSGGVTTFKSVEDAERAYIPRGVKI